MEPYGVKLEVFEGPLDLLLYLIKKDEMDIADIRVSEITQEYLGYLQLMKELNLDMAGEFLVMASTLLQIKAKTLLPASKEGDPAEEGPDPRADLVAKLLEYQKFKEAASVLAQREFESREIFYRHVQPTFAEDDMWLDSTLFDLLDAFREVLRTSSDEVKELIYEEIPVEQKIREILDVLEDKEFILFSQIFSGPRPRRELIVSFLALLELMRLKQIVAKQTELFGEIRIYRVEAATAAAEAEPQTNGAANGMGE